jgi:hypothetical protein
MRSESRSVNGTAGSVVVPGEGEEAICTMEEDSGLRNTPSCDRITARSTRFCSSRMLPGQPSWQSSAP